MASTKSQEKLLQQLQEIWLNPTDARLYLASIHLGACTVQQLAEYTHINRITTHDGIKRLIKKGLLLETFSHQKKLIFPQQINNLQHLVDIKKSELDQLQHKVSQTISLLQSLHLESAYLPHIRIMKWREGIRQMVNEIKEQKQAKISVISDSWHFDELLTVNFLESLEKNKHGIDILLPPWFEHFIFSAHAKGIAIQSRTIPEHMPWKWGMTLRENFVALHAYEGVYITTTLIENTAITDMMKTSFQTMRERHGE